VIFSFPLQGETFFWPGERKNKLEERENRPGGRKNKLGETFFWLIFSSALPRKRFFWQGGRKS